MFGATPAQDPADFLLEIGTEELPAADLADALEQLRSRLPVLLRELRLEYTELHVMGTPRRLVAHIKELAPRQPNLEQVVKGPPASRAFDEAGLPTPAAIGFARSKGLQVKDLEVRTLDGGRYVVAMLQQSGRLTGDVLAEALPGLLASVRFERPMRWNSSNVPFSRPVRWLLALYAGMVVPFEFAGVSSGDTTRGLRFRSPEEIQVKSPGEYFAYLAGQGILLDVAERQACIQSQVLELASTVEGSVPPDDELLAEVTNLVEQPTALLGSFDSSHLQLPREVLISVMKKHQRYFPLEKDGQLLPYFIAVRNGDNFGLEAVTDGNQHVIRARFADAAYFIRQDLKQPLAAYLPKLDKLTFQIQLGSMLDKTQRICRLVERLIPGFKLSRPGNSAHPPGCRAVQS